MSGSICRTRTGRMAGTTLVQCACKVGRRCVGRRVAVICAMQPWIGGQEIAFHEPYSCRPTEHNAQHSTATTKGALTVTTTTMKQRHPLKVAVVDPTDPSTFSHFLGGYCGEKERSAGKCSMFQDANIDSGGLYHCLSSMGLIAPPRMASASSHAGRNCPLVH